MHLPHHEQWQTWIFREYFIISIYNFTDTLGDRFVLLNDYIMYFGNKRKYDITKNGLKHLILRSEIIVKCRSVDTYFSSDITHTGFCEPILYK